PCRIHGALVVLDVFGDTEAEVLIVTGGLGDVRGHDVEMVESGDGASPVGVVATGESLDVLGIVEELDRETERVLHTHRLADASGGPGSATLHSAAEVREV